MSTPVTRARNAVGASFLLNGVCFATWVSRIPEVRATLGLSNSALGLLLLALAAGSVVSLPVSGALVAAFGARRVIVSGTLTMAVSFAGISVFVSGWGLPVGVGVSLFGYGVGTSLWDVAMNVEGATVERRLGRSLMPRLHAAFSIGTVGGAGLGAVLVGTQVPLPLHLVAVAGVVVVASMLSARAIVPAEPEEGAPATRVWTAWRERRTLLVGLMVLAFAFTEGTANDWLAVALIDGFGLPHWAGVVGFACFVSAMTLGRFLGPLLLDRYGRVRVLLGTVVLAVAGVTVLAVPVPWLWCVGPVLWGLGASLGFPVGMSAGADEPAMAAARVAVVSTIGYAAFLAGPPLVGFLADQVGSLRALLVVAVLLLPSALAIPAAREPTPRAAAGDRGGVPTRRGEAPD